MQPIDLRSDTVTRPTPAMREAMATAEVGDDVWGDDPTVIALEREVAAMLGKEAALYVPSGTMGNQIAIRCQTRPGDEILVHELAHVIVHEAGGAAVLSSVQTRMIAGERGLPGPDQLEPWLRDPADEHHARQHLICIENTIGEQGGLIFPQDRIDAIAAFAHERGMRLHMDGARLWNAAVAGGSDPARIVRDVDSVSVCFSKGLGAPVGSAVVGDAEPDRDRPPQPQAAGRRHATGRHHRRRRPARRAPPRRPPGRRPPQRPHPGRGARRLAVACRSIRRASRPTSCSAPSRPARTPRRWSPRWRRPACCAPISAHAPCVS